MLSKKKIKKFIIFILFFAFVINLIPLETIAQEAEHKVVRVGWYDSSFCYYDELGRRCGVDYEYQQKISAYTGWTYEYVEDSWPNLLQMLQDGEIDLLSDVSYKPEREGKILYPDLPMGTESYYIYISADNREITSKDFQSLNGKKIAVSKDSVQQGFLETWKDENDLSFEIIPINVPEDESINMVINGEVDGYATTYSFNADDVMPISRIGGSDYYYGVNKNRPDLLAELNMALAEIQDSDPLFNQKISEDRLYTEKTTALLTPIQEDWVKSHGPIRIGFRDNYLPFCDQDDKTGELTGALKEYLAHAENNLDSPNVEFETVPFASTKDALAALNSGEIDCVFPIYLSTYDADQMGIRLTDSAMKTEMHAIMRTSDDRAIASDSTIKLAINQGMMNIDTFSKEHYPSTTREEFSGLDACYKAVSDGKADCTLVSSYRIPAAEDILEKYDLYSFPTGESMPFSFAVKKWDTELYFLLNKTAIVTKNEEMDAALASYMTADQKVSFVKFLRDNWLIVIIILVVIFTIIIILLVQKMKADRRAHRQKLLLDEAEEIADLKQTISSLLDNMPGMNFTKDAETGVYLACNQEFAEYAHKKSPEEVVGLTPDALFDEETAAAFVEDDKVALSMDEPYIFFTNMTDKDGNSKQVKTTKIKYIDSNGKQCVLGMFQDASDSFKIYRNDAKSKESYEKARNSGIIFTHIAQALAYGYLDLFYIDVNSEEFIEYRLNNETGILSELRRGWHFFEQCLDEIDELVYEEDRESVIKAMDRKTLMAELEKTDMFMMTFRIMRNNEPRYASMRITQMQDDERYIILGISDVDEEIRERDAVQQIIEEKGAYNRITALAGDFFCIYIVNPENGNYREFSATTGFNSFEIPSEGNDFFAAYRKNAPDFVYLEDQNRFVSLLNKDNVLTEVKQNGIFTLSYRLRTDGEPRYVQLKAAMVEESEGQRLIVGVNDIDAQVRQEEEYGRRLAQARIEANIDALTGVKNRNAYKVYEERINAQIEMNRAADFSITILDVNDLKRINDTEGHKAGDQYLRDACRIICNTFKRSPVFRVGGDELCVLSQGSDYARIDELIEEMHKHNEEATLNDGIVIAVGMSRFDKDASVAPVYERADGQMYENKSVLKAKKQKG